MAPRIEPVLADALSKDDDDITTDSNKAQEENELAKERTENESQVVLNNESPLAQAEEHHAAQPRRLPLTISLPMLVMIDMFAVSLVVPLLHQYYKDAGITSAKQRELLSSLFSSSQIAGGLVLGALSDAGVLSRRGTLFLSFAGSSLSYALIVTGNVKALMASRVLVGLVKQTMTVTTSLLARHTSREERAMQMGRLTASSTVAWILGPSCGAVLYRHVHTFAPAMVACGLFVVNSMIAAVFLPREDDEGGLAADKQPGAEIKAAKDEPKKANAASFHSFTSNLKACFTSNALASVVLSLLIFSWVTRTTSYANMASYYEEMYGIEPHHRGYLSSYQQLLNLVVQSTFVRPLLELAGGERRAACIAAVLLAGATSLELHASFRVFIGAICPLVSVSIAMLGLSLRSLVTQVSPKESLGSVLAALDVLQNAAAVTVPFYRTALFSLMAKFGARDENAAMRGDPDPRLWLMSSVVHWLIAASGLILLLIIIPRRNKLEAEEEDKKNR